MPDNAPIPFREAMRQLRQRGLMPTDMTSREIADLGAAVTERAFFSARQLNEFILGEMKARVERIVNPTTGVNADGEAVTVGLDYATARLEMMEMYKLIGYGAPLDEQGTIKDHASEQRINLVLKTNVEQAQGYGQWRQGADESNVELWPAQELFRAEARKEPRDWLTRWIGAGGQLVDGARMIALKNDPIWEAISAWGLPYPPFDYGSGMWTQDVARDEAIELGLMTEESDVQVPRRGFEQEEAA